MKHTISACLYLAAAALPAFAGDPNPDGAKTDFDPRRHGFDFVNSWEGDMLLDVPIVGRIDVGDWSYGLCGGMSYSSLDAFYAGLEVPDHPSSSDGSLPDEAGHGQPLRQFIYGRQMDSLKSDDAKLVRRLIAWGALPIHSNWFVKGLAERTSENFRDKIAPALDRGCPVPLCLVKADLGDYLPDPLHPTLTPEGYTKNHQVVAIGYRRHTRGPDHWDIDIYDPNYPDEVHTLHLKLRVQTARVKASGALFANADDPDANRRGRFRALFRSVYDEKQPSFVPSSAAASAARGPLGSARALALKHVPAPVLDEDAAAAVPGPAEIEAMLDELEGRVELLETRAASDENASAASRATGPAVVALDVASDFRPVHATDVLPWGTSELSVAIAAGATADFRTVAAVFVAADVGDVAPPDTEMARAEQPASGPRPARFRYHQEAPLPPGSYRVELLGDGRPWLSLRYRVAEPAPSAPAFEWSLAPGRRWTYSFVQEAAAGTRLVDGDRPVGDRFEASVELRVAAMSSGRSRVEIRRDGALVSQETWTFDPSGLVAHGRVHEGTEYALDPPALLCSREPGAAAWEQDVLGAPQVCRQWGPVELSGPWGRGLGFVVLTRQDEGPVEHTVEREFVPGVGLVRERITSAVGGELVMRQDMVLQPGGAG